METTLDFTQVIDGESTNVVFNLEDDVTAGDFLGYLFRFALAVGFLPESIEDAICTRANEINSR